MKLHRYRLAEPTRRTKGQTIFVCSMADLFGEWVPDAWIEEVFQACAAAPQHRYLFLTKNPKRYIALSEKGLLPDANTANNLWFGTSAPTPDHEVFWSENHRCFASIEPILGDFPRNGIPNNVDWVIVGAETGTRKGMVKPNRSWIENLMLMCDESLTPLFMKNSLRELMGEDFTREFPWADGCAPGGR